MTNIDYETTLVTEGEDDVVIGTVTGSITPKEIWENKNEWFEAAKTSREEYGKMSDDQREALERMVTGAIERMHDRVGEWLPEGLTVEGGKFVDVHIKLLFTDIDKEIDRNEQATSFQIKAAQNETAAALAEFESAIAEDEAEATEPEAA